MKKILPTSLLLLILFSCGSLNGSYREQYTNIFINRYWGDWKNATYDIKMQYSGNDYEVVFHNPHSHPANYYQKLIFNINTHIVNEKGLHTYRGTISCSRVEDDYIGLKSYYTNSKGNNFDTYYSFPAEIVSTRAFAPNFFNNKEAKKKGTVINVFYNGVGRAWSF